MRRNQSAHTHKIDRRRYIAANVSDLCNFYCMSAFELGQGSFVFRALAHDLNDDESTCDEQRASDTDSDSRV